jgi:hypothetical protein
MSASPMRLSAFQVTHTGLPGPHDVDEAQLRFFMQALVGSMRYGARY